MPPPGFGSATLASYTPGPEATASCSSWGITAGSSPAEEIVPTYADSESGSGARW